MPGKYHEPGFVRLARFRTSCDSDYGHIKPVYKLRKEVYKLSGDDKGMRKLIPTKKYIYLIQ